MSFFAKLIKAGTEAFILGIVSKINHVASAFAILVVVVLGFSITTKSAAQTVNVIDKTNSTTTIAAPTGRINIERIEWGQGILEMEFLTKLRIFLEQDPLNFNEFERVFGAKLEPHPKEGPYYDGSWGIEIVGALPWPFGAENSGHTLGTGVRGARYFFLPSRDEKYMRIELLTPSRGGWTSEEKLPCIQLSDIPRAFNFPTWKRRKVFEEVAGVSRFIGDQYRYYDGHGDEILVSIDPRISTCLQSITVILPKMAEHPATKN